MNRMCIATLITLCSLTAAAPAQVYTSWYGPTYGHSFPASTRVSYSTWRGPLGLFDWRWWSGQPRFRTVNFYSPWSGSPSQTVRFGPWGATRFASTSFFTPTGHSAMFTPALASADTCCIVPTTCCAPTCCPTGCCGTGLACASGNCPGGNCSMNYSPDDGMAPQPDPGISGSSGTRRFESESDPGAADPNAADPNAVDPNDDQFRRTDPNRPNDGYDDSTTRGAAYGPRSRIEQRNDDAGLPKAPPVGLPDAEEEEFRAAPPAEAPPAEAPTGGLDAPGSEPAADLLDLDSKVTQASPLPIRRHSLRARFGSPQLARATVDPAALPAPIDLRLVKK